MYTIICDLCGVDHNEDQEVAAWNDSNYAVGCALESDWVRVGSLFICDKCRGEVEEGKIEKLQDGDGHWYWIPISEVDRFIIELRELDGIDYMDNPDKFDAFTERYGGVHDRRKPG